MLSKRRRGHWSKKHTSHLLSSSTPLISETIRSAELFAYAINLFKTWREATEVNSQGLRLSSDSGKSEEIVAGVKKFCLRFWINGTQWKVLRRKLFQSNEGHCPTITPRYCHEQSSYSRGWGMLCPGFGNRVIWCGNVHGWASPLSTLKLSSHRLELRLQERYPPLLRMHIFHT